MTNWILPIAVLLFQAGGFIYITRNHLKHLKEVLDKVSDNVDTLNVDMAVVKEKVRRLSE